MNDRSGTVKPDHKEQLIQYIQGGNHSVTFVLAENNITNFSLVGSGVLSAVLNHLKRCEHESLETVVTSSARLKSPALWIKVLLRAAESEPSCTLQIAENIDQLVRCMCNDMDRVFFKSNKHWNESIVSFVQLISAIVCDSINDQEDTVADTLFNYDGLLSSVVQWAFWGEKERPDITRDLTTLVTSCIAEMGRSTASTLILLIDNYLRDVNGDLTENGKERLLTIGTTPIVSRNYDSTCMVSFVAGVIRYAKTYDWGEHDVRILGLFIYNRDFVDKDVITEMIDWGMNHADFDDALEVASLSSSLIIQKANERYLACDTRVAFAIRHGLIEMCLNFIDQFKEEDSRGDNDKASLSNYITNIFRNIYFISLHQKTANAICSKRGFREHESFVNDKLPMRDVIRWILEGINSVALHKKTAKAINKKRSSIEEKLDSLEQISNITRYPKYKELLDMVKSTLSINGSYCCRCNKSLSKTNVKVCNGCHRMTYCSRACQREDWLNGHNITCCKSYTSESIGYFQGRVMPPTMPENKRDATKLEELEVNQTMIQLKLLLDNAEDIKNKQRHWNFLYMIVW